MNTRHAALSPRRLFTCSLFIAAISTLAIITGCQRQTTIQRQTKIIVASSENGRVEDISFYSPSLRRTMQYRIVLPNSYNMQPQSQSRVLYLLHGRGGSYSDWQTQSHVAETANLTNFILVMPQGDNSYYLNAALKPASRYEDYITKDLIQDVERHYRVLTDRRSRAIAGVSMGGFGALALTLKHPELYFFSGSISAPLDITERKFSFNNTERSIDDAQLFGFGSMRRKEDPFRLIENFKTGQGDVPVLFLSCGIQDSLLPANRVFAKRLAASTIPHYYNEGNGGHNWAYWDSESERMMSALVSAADSSKK